MVADAVSICHAVTRNMLNSYFTETQMKRGLLYGIFKNIYCAGQELLNSKENNDEVMLACRSVFTSNKVS